MPELTLSTDEARRIFLRAQGLRRTVFSTRELEVLELVAAACSVTGTTLPARIASRASSCRGFEASGTIDRPGQPRTPASVSCVVCEAGIAGAGARLGVCQTS